MELIMSIMDILGGRKIFHKAIRNRMDLIDLSNKGISRKALINLANYLEISTHQIAQLLPVTERTIQRYTQEKHFNRVVSEHILQIAEVAAKGSKTFGDKEQFLIWINLSNEALNNKTPLSLLNSKFGADIVLDELGRIEHGIFS